MQIMRKLPFVSYTVQRTLFFNYIFFSSKTNSIYSFMLPLCCRYYFNLNCLSVEFYFKRLVGADVENTFLWFAQRGPASAGMREEPCESKERHKGSEPVVSVHASKWF